MKKIIIFLVILLIMSGCTPEKVTYEYDDYPHISDWRHVNNLEQGFYHIYVYSEYCITCDDIKQNVLTFAQESKNEVPFYLVDYYDVVNDPPFDFTYTPTLVVMEGDEVVSVYDTKEAIQEFIDSFYQ
ncbi:MAG: lipoprotein [Candidatus Izemoplasmataceae bacterium]